jgi:hypothetical protein
MPGPSTTNVLVPGPLVTGGVLVAPTGTALPVDEAAALNAAFTALGFITDDGVENADSIDTDVVRAWGGVIIATTQSSRTATFAFTMAEYFNADVNKLVWGDANVQTVAPTASSGTKFKVSASAYARTPFKSFVFEMNGDGAAKSRIVVPRARVTDMENRTFVHTAVTGRGVTLTAFPDAAGNSYYEYGNDGISTGS